MLLAMINYKFVKGCDVIIQVSWQFLSNFSFLSKHKVISIHESGTPTASCFKTLLNFLHFYQPSLMHKDESEHA